MTEARAHRQFGSTEHLASEAIAAYVDGELRMQAYLRASHHISICAECAAAVDAQQQARGALRRSGEMTMPLSLVGLLSQIPSCNSPSTGPNSENADSSVGNQPVGFSTISKRLSRRWRK
ncbi:RNA polymerase subunit sigma-70 [Rhodococcus erythropolis]|jgi:hypothetical protein|uniref:RNA polymerase subunit sigma-70 n=1 Tax=Rhodococcus baikonurensis TaxID=172041 RepID=UPI0026193ED5|nr:RNA polymerase subunit sigma-70 [uncultured Rhodococcus sp.]